MTVSVPAGLVPFPKFGGFIDDSGPFFRTDLVVVGAGTASGPRPSTPIRTG